MRAAKLSAPDIDYDTLQPEHDPAAFFTRALETDNRVENKLLQTGPALNLECPALAVSGCVLKGLRLTGSNFRRSGWADVVFQNCELSGCNFSDSRFSRVRFENCKLAGTVFAESYLQDVHLKNCVATYANFAATRQFFTQLEESNLSSADFTECELKGIQLSGANLSGATFYRTPLKGVDLSSCDISGLGVQASSQELKGAKLDIGQLMELAAMLGITIV